MTYRAGLAVNLDILKHNRALSCGRGGSIPQNANVFGSRVNKSKESGVVVCSLDADFAGLKVQALTGTFKQLVELQTNVLVYQMVMLAGLYTGLKYIKRTLERDSLEMVLLLIHANANRSALEHNIVDYQRRASLRHRQSRVSDAAVGHVEQDVGQLHGLAHGPVEQRDVVGWSHFGRVQNDILQGNVEVDCWV